MTTRKMSKEPHSPDALLLMQEARAGVPGFFDRACYDFYLRRVFHSLGFFRVALHAYVLLPERVWLLVTDSTSFGAGALTASVNRAYADYFRIRFSRQYQQWPQQPRQIPVYGEAAVLICQKLIEYEPVASGRAANTGQWNWSSYRTNAFGGRRPFVTRHPAVRKFLAQGNDPGGEYRSYINSGFGNGQNQFLRNQITRKQQLGRSSALSPVWIQSVPAADSGQQLTPRTIL